MPRPRRRPSSARPLPFSELTERDRRILAAVLKCGSFQAAANLTGHHHQTVAAVWHQYRPTMGAELFPEAFQDGGFRKCYESEPSEVVKPGNRA